MTVYLIHLDTPLAHARHYLGCTEDLERRIKRHRSGRGARLMVAVRAAGITWQLVRTWAGGFDLERKLKSRHQASDYCPLCAKENSK